MSKSATKIELNQGHQELLKMVLDPDSRREIRNALRVQYENEDIEWIKNNERNLEAIIRIQLSEALKKAKVIETPTAIFQPKEEN
tara:strand:- start:754 stop:1008 length:255 start_codon:yes stop_codon:yes gene_type:complete